MSERDELPDGESLDALLDACADALDEGDYEQALAQADSVLAQAPQSLDGLHFRAAALAELGRVEEAHAAYGAALELAPEDVDVLHGAAELLILEMHDDHDALEDALELLSRALKLTRHKGEPEQRAQLLLLSGTALNMAGQPDRALEVLAQARTLDPDNLDVRQERGVSLFELGRFQDARKQFQQVLEKDAEAAWACHYLGLIAERLGEHDEAVRQFDAACRLAPDDLAPAVEMSAEAFDKVVEEALEKLPARVHKYLENVTIIVEELPSDHDLGASEPPLSPCILGLFRGTPVTEASISDPWSHMPSAIMLYQRNLQRFARTRDELVEQIGITLIHEVGHFLGLSEEELYERGLD